MDMSDSLALMPEGESRQQLAGVSPMEILLFSLGTRELFGINVFRVREVGMAPLITRTPNMPRGVEGLVTLRGNVIPVLSLSTFLGLERPPAGREGAMMVAEFSCRTLGFLVHQVDRIIRVDWTRVKASETGMSADRGLITSVIEMENGQLLSIIDVEQVLANAFGEKPVADIAPAKVKNDAVLFFADDSAVARRQITEVLDQLGVKYKNASNGQEAWTRLQAIAAQAQQQGRVLRDELRLILVDAEMPEMDGYMLTRHIRGDARFKEVPVIMHSSLASEANRAMGKVAGVDAFIPKFDAEVLADTLRPLLER